MHFQVIRKDTYSFSHCCVTLCDSTMIELICGALSLGCILSVYLLFMSEEKCGYLKCPFVVTTQCSSSPAIFLWFYSSDGFNIVGKWVLFSTTELHAIVFFRWFELTSLLEQAHSRAPHIENLKSTPCGQFYFNPRSPASLSCLRPDQGFWLPLLFKGLTRSCNYSGFWCCAASHAEA